MGILSFDQKMEANNTLHTHSTISGYAKTQKTLLEENGRLCSQSKVLDSSLPFHCLSFICNFYLNQFLSFTDQFIYIHSEACQGVLFASQGPVEVGKPQKEVKHHLCPHGQWALCLMVMAPSTLVLRNCPGSAVVIGTPETQFLSISHRVHNQVSFSRCVQ